MIFDLRFVIRKVILIRMLSFLVSLLCRNFPLDRLVGYYAPTCVLVWFWHERVHFVWNVSWCSNVFCYHIG